MTASRVAEQKLPDLNAGQMLYLDQTLATPAENLACDEALLDAAEAGECGESLRFWTPREHFVVLGYANHASQEVDLEACRARGVPVFRRCSGGGTVLQGPGCLNYNLVLKIEPDGPCASVTATNRHVMHRHAEVLGTLLDRPVEVRGITDLTLGDRKFSGNSQRRKHRYLVFHGTFLLDFDLPLIARLLRFPSRQPNYRASRPHADFLCNLRSPPDPIKAALQQAWAAHEPMPALPGKQVRSLVAEKYSTDEWNLKFR